MSQEFFECWQSAQIHLNQQVEGGIQSWIRVHPYPPFREHLSFRLGNQIFFVRVVDTSEKLEGPGSLEGLSRIAREANGLACLLPMKKKFFGGKWVAAESGWGLLDAESGKPIDPFHLVSDEKIEMTDWELLDISVQVVRNYLEKQGCTVTQWLSDPAVYPSIWFFGDSGLLEWVVVKACRYPAMTPERPENWLDIVRTCGGENVIGHFATVSVASADDVFDPADGVSSVPLWRGYRMLVRFTGLE